MEKTAEFYLRVENFKPEMILENRLAEVMGAKGPAPTGPFAPASMADMVKPFVERVQSPTPVPGGGSVAALAGALGAALGQMAIRITKEKKDYAQHSDRFNDALDRLAPYTATLLELID